MTGHIVLLASLLPLFPALLPETASAVGGCSSLAQLTTGFRVVPSPAEDPSTARHASHSGHAKASLAHWDTAPGGLGISSSSVARDLWGQDADALPAYDLVIVVPTHGRRDLDRRQAIRDSWAQYFNKSVTPVSTVCRNRSTKLLFVVGTEGGLADMKREAEEFKDMGVLQDFGQEEYGSGGAEKTQRSIRYAVEHFKFRLLLKVDSDSWVFVDRLFSALDRRGLWGGENGTLLSVYGGQFQEPGEQGPSAAPTGDAIVALSSVGLNSSRPPPHAAGAGYLLSPDLCEFIAGMGAPSEQARDGLRRRPQASSLWAPYPRLASLPDEDAAVGLWLMALNHTKVPLPVSSKGIDCEAGEGGGATLSSVIDHPVTTDEMRRRWRSYTELGDPCILQVGAKGRQKAQEKVTQWLNRHIAMPGDVARAAVQRVWQHVGKTP